jgi:hypothetical protein
MRRRLVLEREPDLERHLPMGDAIVLDLPARADHLEPAQVAKRAPRFPQRIVDGILDAGRRRSDELDGFVDVVQRSSLQEAVSACKSYRLRERRAVDLRERDELRDADDFLRPREVDALRERLADVFREPLFAADLRLFFAPRRGGTFAPSRRASDRPIAIACFRLRTVFPDRPLLSDPRLRLRMASSTFSCALRPYFAITDLLPRYAASGAACKFPSRSCTRVRVSVI